MSEQLSPGMRQYMEAKLGNPDAILFFRMGDFYELFFEDAETAAPILEIALTSRSKQAGKSIPMCGVPHYAVEGYINRLTDRGYKVAVCEQLEDASKAKGLVARGVTRVVTPGVTISAEGQVPSQPRFLIAIQPLEDSGRWGWGLAGLEVSTGDLILGHFDSLERLRAELAVMEPHECLLSAGPAGELLDLAHELNIYVTQRPPESLNAERALNHLEELFGRHAVAGWEIEKWPAALAAAGAVLEYASTMCGGQLKHLAPPRLLWQQPYMGLDESAIANLELLKTLRHGALEGSLLGLMDKTSTPMGGRLLRQWLVRPLLDAEIIAARHGAVEELLRDGLSRDELASLLKKISDLERALSRLVLNRGGPRDLAAVRDTLVLMPVFKRLLMNMNSARLAALGEDLPDLVGLTSTLQKYLTETPPLNPKEGGLINRGVSAELDELLDLEKGGKNHIAALEARDRAATGINSLKVGFNRVYGYYLEVTRTNLHLVPDHWIRKQTIANGERYLTQELKDWEEKILNAGEKRLALEEELLNGLKTQVVAASAEIKRAAQILAETDVLASFAACADRYDWVRPELAKEDIIDIKGGRHPVVEAFLPSGEPFVANDILLTPRERLLIITGPNMAGKSTILRQTALIVLLNQIGSFVSADSARLSLRDHIFTRVGAADDLTRGRSTFMVEMNETARILALATPRSLVVLDEIGRGTSTYDGLSIAWAVSEHLHDLDGLGAPTIFATHYHELVALSHTKPRVRNFNVAVKDWQGKIIFLRKLMPGGASRSYGLAVAALAGLPAKVIDRAKEVLADLSEAGEHLIRPAIRQYNLFEMAEPSEEKAQPVPELIQTLAETNPEELSPLAALTLLSQLNEEARSFIKFNRGE